MSIALTATLTETQIIEAIKRYIIAEMGMTAKGVTLSATVNRDHFDRESVGHTISATITLEKLPVNAFDYR